MLDLGMTWRNLGGNVLGQFIAMADSGGDDLVVDEQDLLIAHLLDFRADCEVHRSDRIVMELNDSDLAVTRNTDFIESGDSRFLQSHFRSLTWQCQERVRRDVEYS
jgi:hypothetical protein